MVDAKMLLRAPATEISLYLIVIDICGLAVRRANRAVFTRFRLNDKGFLAFVPRYSRSAILVRLLLDIFIYDETVKTPAGF